MFDVSILNAIRDELIASVGGEIETSEEEKKAFVEGVNAYHATLLAYQAAGSR